MKGRIVYLVDETLEHPVLQSQSLAVMRRLIDAGVAMDLLVANGVDQAREVDIARGFLGAATNVVVLSTRYTGSSVLAKGQRAIRRTLTRRRAARFVHDAGAGGKPIVLHARGSAMHLGAYLRARFKDTRLVADVRGDSAAEARFHLAGLGGERRAEMLDRLEAQALSHADHVICISATLLGEVRKRFAIACPATVIPCVADEQRFFPDADRRLEARASLGLSSEPLIVYAGSIGQWHQFEATLDTFVAVALRDSRARFLVATRDAEKARAIVSARGELQGRASVRDGDANEVARWLSAADIGLLLREPHALNRVACPTKFAEYALSGLSVVVSEEIGDLAGWVRVLDLGMCVRGADAAAAAEMCQRLILRNPEGHDRKSLAQRASSVLSMGARLRDWMETYEATLRGAAARTRLGP